jgi:preprotein translocase subunit SecB
MKKKKLKQQSATKLRNYLSKFFLTSFQLGIFMDLELNLEKQYLKNINFDNPGCPGQLTRTTTNPRTH